MKTGNKEAHLERLNDNPYRLNRLVMFPQMTQQQFVDSVVPGQLSRQMLRNVELGLPTTPPENLTFILSHHSSSSLYYQDPDRLLADYQQFQIKTRIDSGLLFGSSLPESHLYNLHSHNITALASMLCYPLQQLQRLNDDSRPSAVGDSFKRVLRDLGYTEEWITQLARNHEAALSLHKSKKKVTFS